MQVCCKLAGRTGMIHCHRTQTWFTSEVTCHGLTKPAYGGKIGVPLYLLKEDMQERGGLGCLTFYVDFCLPNFFCTLSHQ